MGYRSEVSIIVGKKVERKIQQLVNTIRCGIENKKYTKGALDNLECIIDTRSISSNGKYVRYYHDYIKWYTHCPDPDYIGLAMLDDLVKEYCSKFDYKDGEEASFIRLGEDEDDREDLCNCSLLQELSITTSLTFISNVQERIDTLIADIDSATERLEQLKQELADIKKVAKIK